jgi:hypothetical protein
MVMESGIEGFYQPKPARHRSWQEWKMTGARRMMMQSIERRRARNDVLFKANDPR